MCMLTLRAHCVVVSFLSFFFFSISAFVKGSRDGTHTGVKCLSPSQCRWSARPTAGGLRSQALEVIASCGLSSSAFRGAGAGTPPWSRCFLHSRQFPVISILGAFEACWTTSVPSCGINHNFNPLLEELLLNSGNISPVRNYF